MTVEFDSFFLSKMRRKALRKGVWFRVLDCSERAMLSLVPRCMEKPRSAKLIDMLAKIIVKIKDALKSRIHDLISQVGRPSARRLSLIAQKWGNMAAVGWALDAGFWEYLTVVDMNNIPEFRVTCDESLSAIQSEICQGLKGL
jgi:hypothetical protein